MHENEMRENILLYIELLFNIVSYFINVVNTELKYINFL